MLHYSNKSFQRLRERVDELKSHIDREEECEIEMVDSKLKTLRLAKLNEGQWYGGLMCYRQDTDPRQVIGTFTMQLPLHTLKKFIEKFLEIDEALKYFQCLHYKNNNNDQDHTNDGGPSKKAKLGPSEIEMYCWKRAEDEWPANGGVMKYWWESLCRAEALEASSNEQRFDFDIKKVVGSFPGVYDLTKDCASMVVLGKLAMQGYVELQPCTTCVCTGGDHTPHPCYGCLWENAAFAEEWDLDCLSKDIQFHEKSSFAEELSAFLDFLKSSLGGFRESGSSLAHAFVFYSDFDKLKEAFVETMKKRSSAYFVNLAYSLNKFYNK